MAGSINSICRRALLALLVLLVLSPIVHAGKKQYRGTIVTKDLEQPVHSRKICSIGLI